jgi:hypothetical protein
VHLLTVTNTHLCFESLQKKVEVKLRRKTMSEMEKSISFSSVPQINNQNGEESPCLCYNLYTVGLSALCHANRSPLRPVATKTLFSISSNSQFHLWHWFPPFAQRLSEEFASLATCVLAPHTLMRAPARALRTPLDREPTNSRTMEQI